MRAWVMSNSLLLCLALGASSLRAETYYVRAGGDDRADGKTPKTAFRTLLRAARILNHGDRIVIGAGTYRESVLIAERFGSKARPLAIIGDESGQVTGDPAGPVVIESLQPGEAALRLHRSRDLLISGLTIRGAGEGIRIEETRGVRIERSTFDRLAKAVTIDGCEDVRIESCVLTRGAMGVLIRNTTRARLAHLSIASMNAAGVMISTSAGGEIRNCLFVDNSTAMVSDSASAPSWTSDHNTLCGTIGSWGSAPLCRIPYEWFAATGQERHSNFVAPAFVDPEAYDLHIEPAIAWGGGLPGMYAGVALDPPVERDRDGKPFTVRGGHVGTGAYNYPDPAPGPEWKNLDLALPEGVRQSAAIYAKDGTLVRTLLADATGVLDLWWDGLDDTGAAVPAGEYEVRAIGHDIRALDDGSLGDNGNPMGTYNCDNAERVVVFGDGSFAITTLYDEAGIPLRFHSASGQPVSGSALSDQRIWAIAAEGKGKGLIAGVNREIQRLVAPGERITMPSGAKSYPILGEGESLGKAADGKGELPFGGVAVSGGRILVTVPLATGSVIRVLDLASGRKVADWPVPSAGDIDADAEGNVWILCGNDLVCADPRGEIAKRFPTPVRGAYIAVGKTEIAVISPGKGKIAFLDRGDGRVTRILGTEREVGKWLPVSGNLFRNLRDAAFLPDGHLLVCEYGRIRAIVPETATETMAVHSNFMDALVPHPKDPSIVYCYGAAIFRLDHASGAWEMLREAPHEVAPELWLRRCITTAAIDGRPYLLVHGNDRHQPTDEEKKQEGFGPRAFVFIDISDPLSPRYAGAVRAIHGPGSYSDVRFDRDGNFCHAAGGEDLRLVVNRFLGRDAQGHLRYANYGVYGKPDSPLERRGIEKDPSPRGMTTQGGLSIDTRTNEYYILAITAQHRKLVPAWGASGTGVGKLFADGRPLWFTLSSGGNYMSISNVFDGRDLWVMAAKDFGGQVEVFSSDGLRLATSNWSWPCHWTCGFVDLREGLQAYMRPDGKPGAHVEDDSIGRFNRIRLDGTETVKRAAFAFRWTPAESGSAPRGPIPMPQEVMGKTLRNRVAIPRAKELAVDGDWAKWQAAGVTPQILSLPIIGWAHTYPEGLLQSFDAGTSIGALAHDGKDIYAYFLTTDDTPHFHAPGAGGNMFEFDSIELWIEEDQFGLGFNDEGKPRLFKYRHHDRQGKPWSAGYPMSDTHIWGALLPNVAEHPLGKLLGAAVGASLEGKPGYALMARIPMEEVKLVGGIAGRRGGEILPMTGKPGEALRIGVSFDGMSVWGRSQDFKVYWPAGLMFSDPTTNVPFVLGE